jgi:cytosine/creatinine deaminase
MQAVDQWLRNGRLAGDDESSLVDLAIAGGKIVAITPASRTGSASGAPAGAAASGPTVAGTSAASRTAAAPMEFASQVSWPRFGAASEPPPEIDLAGRLISAPLVETHIHLDKSCILERCRAEEGTLAEAISEVTRAKRDFDDTDVYARAQRTLKRCVAQGTGVMRTHVEIDPGIGLTGFHAVQRLAHDWRWAIDVELCVFPQEGMLNNPGTEALLVQALREGAQVLGACPYTDSDPAGQIERIFQIAREHDVDIDMHLDFGDTPEQMWIEQVAQATQRYRWGGRVAVGHVTRLSTLAPERFAAIGRQLADAGVAVTVLPSTDLYLMGRGRTHDVIRAVTPAHRLLAQGVNCSISTNNVLNPFTPFGDCSLTRMANLYANVCQVGRRDEVRACFEMVTRRSAQLLRRTHYAPSVGASADLVVLDCASSEAAVAEVAPPLFGMKAGHITFARPPAMLNHP